MPQPDFQGIVSLARIQVQSKGTNKVQKFMCVLRPNLGESEESSLCMGQNGNVVSSYIILYSIFYVFSFNSLTCGNPVL